MASLPLKTYSVSEVAQMLGCNEGSVRRYCRDGNVPADEVQIPGTRVKFYMLPETSVDWLRKKITPRRRTAGD